jgi:hypothetical protein
MNTTETKPETVQHPEGKPAVKQSTPQEPKAEQSAKPKAKAAPKQAARHAKPKATGGDGKLGVGDVVLAEFRKGRTKDQVLDALIKEFPDRSVVGMSITLSAAVNGGFARRGLKVTKKDVEGKEPIYLVTGVAK